jgi:hypothetical protein
MQRLDEPSRAGDTRDAVLGFDLGLVDGDLGEMSRIFVPLERVRDNTRDVDFAAKVAREVACASVGISKSFPSA